MTEGMIKEFKTTYVFGDLHADYYTFRNMLIDVKIIDGNGRMVAKDIYIVQIGDGEDGKAEAITNTPPARKLCRICGQLAEQAPALGSRVFCLGKPRIHELHRRF